MIYVHRGGLQNGARNWYPISTGTSNACIPAQPRGIEGNTVLDRNKLRGSFRISVFLLMWLKPAQNVNNLNKSSCDSCMKLQKYLLWSRYLCPSHLYKIFAPNFNQGWSQKSCLIFDVSVEDEEFRCDRDETKFTSLIIESRTRILSCARLRIHHQLLFFSLLAKAYRWKINKMSQTQFVTECAFYATVFLYVGTKSKEKYFFVWNLVKFFLSAAKTSKLLQDSGYKPAKRLFTRISYLIVCN